MGSNEDPIQVLSEDESWELLATQNVGRLVTRVRDVVEIVPINFVVDGDTLVFRTAAGSKLSELTVNPSVVFEADSFDGAGGWSVVVRGDARALDRSDEIAEAEALPLRPFVPTFKPTFVRVRTSAISGRRFRFGEEPGRDEVQEG